MKYLILGLVRKFHTDFNMARKAETPQFEFIVTELDLALTFWDIANSTQDERRATRILKHAKKAYTAAIHFLNNARLNRARQRVVHRQLQQLESLLTSPTP